MKVGRMCVSEHRRGSEPDDGGGIGDVASIRGAGGAEPSWDILGRHFPPVRHGATQPSFVRTSVTVRSSGRVIFERTFSGRPGSGSTPR